MRTNAEGGRRASTLGGRARRNQIVEAAAEVLAEVGYAAASVALIAERAGVSKGVVTYHFTSKDEILRRVAVELLEECAAHVARATAGAATPRDRLRAGILAETTFFSTRRLAFLAMAEVMTHHRDTDLVRTFEDVADGEILGLTRLMEEGRAQGQFRDVDPREAAHLVRAGTVGLLDRWAGDDSLDLPAATASLLDLLDHALGAMASG